MSSNNKGFKRKLKILIGSSIRQEADTLKHFLDSLDNLEKNNILVNYYFIDDNEESSSRDLLKDFKSRAKEKIIIQKENAVDSYICNEDTHHWNEKLIWKVAKYKNRIIDYCKKNNYDYLFLIDSDIVLHPKTLNHLISTKKDIISEIFWTKWRQDSSLLPQVWLYDQYSMIEKGREEKLSQRETSHRLNNFIEKLKEPGIYEVGGLGACTLISKKALNKGVNYDEIYNISFWGEDRHFSIRAAVLGFKLYVDTTYPAYHIYRKSDLDGVRDYKEKCLEGEKSDFDYSKEISIKSNISSIVKNFIKNFYSCDYRVVTGFEGYRYLSPHYIEKLSQSQDTIIGYLTSHKTICTADIIDLNINTEKIHKEVVEAEVRFSISSKEANTENQKYFSCSLHLKKYKDSLWLIDFISLRNSENKNILGFSLDNLLKAKERVAKSENNKLTLMMLVRNEENKFLSRVLSHSFKYIDNAVILDDASEDNTVGVCKRILKDKLENIVTNKSSNFKNEIYLRKQLWEMTLKTNPDWILCLDADEVFENNIINYIRDLINQSSFDYYSFRLFDMWDESYYREDTYWMAHKYYRIFLIRYQPNFYYTWNEAPQHCGRFPNNITKLDGCQCNIRLKHYGWSNEALRKEKYRRYMDLDPEGVYGNINQYETILDKNPSLIKWKEI
ncbi:glycosyltransferase family 2 protein [Maledivibacter halophilus]|uniref:Predicted glycosyltransferases n=1 Tax=Maledivibacter halophilus TaxID=36842 RepID=A0A1T5M7X6_9FIRM|nr:glycosyltransferase [Maledivibacter halophilus]SKC84203.1 Predicted glycosyltransferases [Maledivibacter halophilus]